MKNNKVRCWGATVFNEGFEDKLYFTYMEGHLGYQLISCLSCGQIYSVAVALEEYVGPPLKEKIQKINCLKCGHNLGKTSDNYPDRYLSKCGGIKEFEIPETILPDDQSEIIEFPGIY